MEVNKKGKKDIGTKEEKTKRKETNHAKQRVLKTPFEEYNILESVRKDSHLVSLDQTKKKKNVSP